MWAPLPVGVEDPSRPSRAVHAAMADLKESGQAVGAQVLTAAGRLRAADDPVSQAARLQPRQRFFNLVVTNVPGPQFPLYLLGRRWRRSTRGPARRGQALGIAIMSYDGKLCFGLLATTTRCPTSTSWPASSSGDRRARGRGRRRPAAARRARSAPADGVRRERPGVSRPLAVGRAAVLALAGVATVVRVLPRRDDAPAAPPSRRGAGRASARRTQRAGDPARQRGARCTPTRAGRRCVRELRRRDRGPARRGLEQAGQAVHPTRARRPGHGVARARRRARGAQRRGPRATRAARVRRVLAGPSALRRRPASPAAPCASRSPS